MIIGLVGLIGSGKSTAANRLIKFHNFKEVSFASSLKDVVSIMFDWPRHMLEGNTMESRAWRDQIDEFWTRELGWDEAFTPRKALQYFGTNVIRNNLHQDFWVLRLKKSLMGIQGNIVVSDCRFSNEIKMIKDMGGEVWQIQRGDLPVWFDEARIFLKSKPNLSLDQIKALENKYGAHSSEWMWVSAEVDRKIYNNDLDEFLRVIDDLVSVNQKTTAS